jgi:hypothetical protein
MTSKLFCKVCEMTANDVFYTTVLQRETVTERTGTGQAKCPKFDVLANYVR